MGMKDRRTNLKHGKYSTAIILPAILEKGKTSTLAADRLILIDPRGEIPEKELLSFLEEFIEPNFWGQTISEVLPPDERPELKHNRNLFTLDAQDRRSELSAGDTFLLPYWMGRFLGVISAPHPN